MQNLKNSVNRMWQAAIGSVMLMAITLLCPSVANATIRAALTFDYYWAPTGNCSGTDASVVIQCTVQAWAGSGSVVSGCAETSRYIVPGSTGIGAVDMAAMCMGNVPFANCPMGRPTFLTWVPRQ